MKYVLSNEELQRIIEYWYNKLESVPTDSPVYKHFISLLEIQLERANLVTYPLENN